MAAAYFYVSGPVDAFVRIPTIGAGPFVTPSMLKTSGGTPTFLGHCEKAPKNENQHVWKPVFTSQTGEAIPHDKLYMGQEVKFALPLQRFDYDVVQALRAAPRYGRGTDPGTESYLDRGALLQRNGLGVEVWLRNAFYNTVNASAYGNLPIGTYFVCCNVAGVITDKEGRDATMATVLFEANWVQIAPNGNLVCYTQDPTFFTALPTSPG